MTSFERVSSVILQGYNSYAVLLFSPVSVTALACKPTPKKPFVYEPSIASIIHEEEMEYLDNMIRFYSTLSETGKNLYEATLQLEKQTSAYREKFLKGEAVSIFAQHDFFDTYKGTFNQSSFVDYGQWEKLRNIRWNNVADIDLVER